MADNVTCLILAGGLGTRLGRLVKNMPKPMLKVNNRPFLEYAISYVNMYGINDVILCVGYKGDIIKSYFGNGKKYKIRIRYSQEQELLGTAGALANAKKLIHSDPFVVMNGDSFCEVDLKEVLTRHRLRNPIGTIVTVHTDDCSRYNRVIFNKDGVITSFKHKQGKPVPGYINGGIYVLRKSVLNHIPSVKFCSLENDIFPKLIPCGLYAFESSRLFIDIGTPSDLERSGNYLKALEEKL